MQLVRITSMRSCCKRNWLWLLQIEQNFLHERIDSSSEWSSASKVITQHIRIAWIIKHPWSSRFTLYQEICCFFWVILVTTFFTANHHINGARSEIRLKYSISSKFYQFRQKQSMKFTIHKHFLFYRESSSKFCFLAKNRAGGGVT